MSSTQRDKDALVGAPDRSTIRTAITAASAGNVVEFYDNITFGLLAATLGQVFFPSDDPAVSLLSAFAAFAVTFIARPFGAMLFGTLGDRIGRQRCLVLVILVMTGSTVGIGLLPSYETIGLTAPALLVVFRILQGLSFGGELGGVLTFIVEYVDEGRRGRSIGVVMAAAFVGNLLALGTITLLSMILTETQMAAWGWRVPFLIAGPLGLIGLYIRQRLEETPVFRAVQAAGEVARSPILDVIRHNRRELLLCAGIALTALLPIYLMEVYNTSYLRETVGVTQSEALTTTLVASVVAMVLTIGAGRLSDHLGRRTTLVTSLVLAFVLALPAYLLLGEGSVLGAVGGQSVLGVIRGAITGAAAVVMIELFPAAVRYSGFALSYGLTAAIFGGTAPFVATSLVDVTGNPLMPALYLMAALAVSMVAAWSLRPSGSARSTRPTYASGPEA